VTSGASDPSRTAAETPLELAVSKPSREAEKPPEPGIALCLSGGGYRAMLFHAGALWRLHETDVLAEVQRVSSVSGGSIAAGVLALAWPDLESGADFEATVVAPLRRLASVTIDRGSVVGGLLRPRQSIGDRITAAYRAPYLFGERTLGDLPASPRFVFNATNMQSTALWRFSRPYTRDYRVGKLLEQPFPLATVVAASSAFPPFLSPVVLSVDENAYEADPDADLDHAPFTTRPVLTDGGVYDNLGLETALKRYTTILVSDGGGKTEAAEKVQRNWLGHTIRAMMVIDNQVRSLRKRALISAYKLGERDGAYWGIRTTIENYGVETLPCPPGLTEQLAKEPTRLASIAATTQERLINWGYAVCDAATRAHLDKTLPQPTGFPYPLAGVG